MSNHKKIVSAEIREQRLVSEVHVKYDDSSYEKLLNFYSDEISFTPHEFIGLTRDQGMDLFKEKDIAYLQS